MVVLDANILVRAVLGRRVRHLLETYVMKGVRFFAPESVFTEAIQHLPPLVARRGGAVSDVIAAIRYIRTMVEVVDPDFYGISRTIEEARR